MIVYNSVLCLAASLFIASCSKNGALDGAKNAAETGEQTVRITATFYPLYIMCLNITDGVKGIKLECLAPLSAGCLHDYSLTTRDAAKIEECNILVANGADLEPFMEKAMEAKKDALVIASKDYPLLNGNPHVWAAVDGARSEVKTIAAGLARLDSGHSALYIRNAKTYDDKLALLEDEMHLVLAPFKGRGIVTFHEAFPYFAKEFGFNVLSVIEHEAGTAPSAKEAAQTVRIIKEAMKSAPYPALFAEPQYPSSSAKLIEAETGLPLHTLDPCVTGDMQKDAYIKTQKMNALSLARAFDGE